MGRLSEKNVGGGGDPFCPRAGDNLQAWCDYHNARLAGKMEWYVDSGGALKLRTPHNVVMQRLNEDKARLKAEAAKHAHRMNYPITDIA